MFKKVDRLSRKSFPDALFKARRRSSEHFSAVFPRSGHGYAVVIPKKTVRLSVHRHQLKRRIYAILQEFSLPQSLIVFPKASVMKLSYEAMREELAQLIASGAQ